MNKQKQIDEMARIIAFDLCPYRAVHKKWGKEAQCYSDNNFAECTQIKNVVDKLYNAGYRKIPEDSVVLTDEKDIQQYEWSKLVDKMGVIEFGEKVRKETAEKFAERLKEKLNEWLEDNEDLNGKIDFGIAMIELIGVKSLDGEVIAESLIDEIAKEITEGKDV